MIEITKDKCCHILTINGIRCVIQSYKADDFVNLSPIQSGNELLKNSLGNIYINFVKKKISTTGKENAKWKQFVSTLDYNEINKIIKAISHEFKRPCDRK